jgi:UDP-glucose 4-epimerase
MARVLITGGAGFIGSHLAEAVLEGGDEVFVLDDLSTGRLENLAPIRDHERFHLVVESVLHPSVVNELVHKCDQVYHLAAAVGVKLIVEDPVHTITTNVRGTEVVLELCARFGRRLLLASTSEIYGDRRDREPLREDDRRTYGPTSVNRWAYAASKEVDEFLALAWHQQKGLDVVIARLFNTVGERQTGRYGMVIPRFVAAALAGEPIEVHGDGRQTRCFCNVADTVRALQALMREPKANGGIYNVGSTESIEIGQLAELVKDLCRSRSPIVNTPYDQVYGPGFEDMLHRMPSIDRIREAIGWEPRVDLRDTLRQVIAERRGDAATAVEPAIA